MTIKEKLKTLRKYNRMTQKQAADGAEMALSTYQQYENGYRNPGPEIRKRFAKSFNVEPFILDDDSDLIISTSDGEKINLEQPLLSGLNETPSGIPSENDILINQLISISKGLNTEALIRLSDYAKLLNSVPDMKK